MVVEHCRKQIVCSADCVHIACEMQIDILHRHNLRITAAGCAAFYAENRAERRLAQSDYGIFADCRQCVAEAYRNGGFALARRSRIYRRNKNQLAVFRLFCLDYVIINLGFILAVILDFVFAKSDSCRNFFNRLHFCALRYLNIAFVFHLRCPFSLGVFDLYNISPKTDYFIVFSAISLFNEAISSSTVICAVSPVERSRTDTIFASSSRSPKISIYGTFLS